MIIFKDRDFIINEGIISKSDIEKLWTYVTGFLLNDFEGYMTADPPKIEDYIDLHNNIYEYNNNNFYFEDLPIHRQIEIENMYYNKLEEHYKTDYKTSEEICEVFDDKDLLDFLFKEYGKVVPKRRQKIDYYIITVPYANANHMKVECDICGRKYVTRLHTYKKYRNIFNADLCVPCREKKGYSRYGLIPSSKQQRYLCKLLHGKLNYPIDKYFADILLKDKNIVIEYDGSGHSIMESPKTKRKKDLIREEVMLEHGYKTIRIISKFDLLPSDKTIKKIINDAIYNLNNGLDRMDINITKDKFKNLREIEDGF